MDDRLSNRLSPALSDKISRASSSVYLDKSVRLSMDKRDRLDKAQKNNKPIWDINGRKISKQRSKNISVGQHLVE